MGESIESRTTLAEGDEGAVDGGAALFGGGEEFTGAVLEIEVWIVARGPAVCEEVLVEFVAALAPGMNEGEAGSDGGSFGLSGPGDAGRWAAVVFAGPVAEVGLGPAENAEETVCERGIEGRGKTAHGLAEESAKRLVGGFSGGSGVDEIARFDAEGDAAVNAAFPADAAFGETVGVFFKEEGFGAAVAHLLFEILPWRGPAMVPDEGGAGEPEGEAGVAESPAEVDIIACGVEDGVKAADFLEGGFFDGKVTSGEMLGGGVIEHDVGGRAGGCGR